MMLGGNAANGASMGQTVLSEQGRAPAENSQILGSSSVGESPGLINPKP